MAEIINELEVIADGEPRRSEAPPESPRRVEPRGLTPRDIQRTLAHMIRRRLRLYAD